VPYTKYEDPWVNADSATGGGNESTPIVAAALNNIEDGIFDAFAEAEAASAGVASHLADVTDAHDASAISVLDAGGNFTGDDVEEVLVEIAALLVESDLSYVEFTSIVSTTAAEPGAQVVTAGSLAYDGTSSYDIEFFCPNVIVGAAGESVYTLLMLDGTSKGRIGKSSISAGNNKQEPVLVRRRLTSSDLTAGSHTISINIASSAGTTVTADAGAGGAGVLVPGYLRIIRVR